MNGTSVMVLDDEPSMCQVLERFLERQNYHVSVRQSVGDALGSVQRQKFDAYVLDYRLGDGDGLEVAAQIRRSGSDAPIILISGHGSQELLRKAEVNQISEILQKPFTMEALSEALNKSLSAAAPAVADPVPRDHAADEVTGPFWKEIGLGDLFQDKFAWILLRLGAAVALVSLFHH